MYLKRNQESEWRIWYLIYLSSVQHFTWQSFTQDIPYKMKEEENLFIINYTYFTAETSRQSRLDIEFMLTCTLQIGEIISYNQTQILPLPSICKLYCEFRSWKIGEFIACLFLKCQRAKSSMIINSILYVSIWYLWWCQHFFEYIYIYICPDECYALLIVASYCTVWHGIFTPED